MYKFLCNYRATLHLTTGKCPADLLFQKRPYRIRLPKQLVPVLCDKEFRQRDAQQKLKAKQYVDRKVYVKKSTLVPGDVVLVKYEKKGEMVPYCDPKRYIITNTKGSMITAKRDEPRETVTRNSSWIKRVKGHRESESDFNDIKGGDNDVDTESADTASTTNEVEVESTGNDLSNFRDQPISQESDRPNMNRRPPKWHEDYQIGQ